MVFSNTPNINQSLTFQTTTTLPTYIPNPTYYTYVPTTTIPIIFNTNIERKIVSAVPTTTIPSYTFTNIISTNTAVIPTTTTKFNFTISNQVRSIDLSKAVTTTTKPMFSISDNTLVNPQDLTHKDTNILALLQANVLGLLDALLAKKLDTEDELQILAIGEEEKKVNGEKYLIVVVPTVDKDLFKKYIEEREDRFDIKIVSLQENGVKNNPDEVLAFVKKTYNEFPYTYLVFHEKIKPGMDTCQ